MLPQGLTAKYEIHGTLGSGAAGTVLDARDRVIGRRVAVKLVSMNLLGAGLLLLGGTGVWLWYGPRRVRRHKLPGS